MTSIFSSIAEEICTLTVLSFIPIILILISIWSTEALGLYVSWVEGIDAAIVELEPFSLLIFDVANVMSHFSVSDMTNDTCKFILIIRVLLGKVGLS